MSWTINQLIDKAIERFSKENVFFGHGPADASEEAEFLVLRALDYEFDVPVDFETEIDDARAHHVLSLIEKRAVEKIPTSYLLNEAWLAGIPFYCDERVLIPRSYIAELLSEGLEPWVSPEKPVRSILDLCTGSGCLAILASMVFEGAKVTGSDISSDALDVAKINVTNYQLEETVRLVQSDLFENLEGETFDIILSNPPYVTKVAMDNLPEEYRKEPALGLEAGADGLDIVRRILKDAKSHLNAGGLLIVEVGDGHEALEAAFPKLPFMWLTTENEEDMVFMLKKEDLV
ncbi:MAG TPA: 50S ribosomal protein L3 N(5)-glutamine methyltransferase [Sutterella sp.]|nr:50S ribosomal protein L3 N(5)-glutamine methyltransferase [Sutterella sp.]